MNWEAAGAIGEILGALFVVATLLYLARQVRLSITAETSKAYQTHMDAWHALTAMIINNTEVAELYRKGAAGEGPLSPTDQIRFDFLATKVWGLWEHMHLDVLAGLFDKDDAVVWDTYFHDFTNMPGLLAFWEANRKWYADTFIAHVDAKLAEAAKRQQS